MGHTNDKRILKTLLDMYDGAPWFRFAGISGATGQSDIAITGDYSVTPQEFSIIPDPGEIWYVTHVQLSIRDDANLRADRYGASVALVNGIDIQLRNGGAEVESFTSGHPIVDLGSLGSHVDRMDINSFGAGDNFVVAHWRSGEQFGGRPVVLDSRASNYLAVIAQDDFTATGAGLVDHHVKLTGYKRDVPGIGL